MKAITIKQLPHPQSNKLVDTITLMGTNYVLSDKRGYTSNVSINENLMNVIIKEFPTKISNPPIGIKPSPILYIERMKGGYELKWSFLSNDRVELKIFSHGFHVYTSQPIQLVKE